MILKLINRKHFLLLWLLNPFLSGLFLLRNFGSSTQIIPYLLLSFFFGFSFVLDPNSLADSARYSQQFKTLYADSPSFTDYMANLYDEEGSKLDLYQPIVTWLLSQFTGNSQWLFGTFALVFGFFWFKSLLLIRAIMPVHLGGLLLLSLLVLALINPIWNINGVRMWTAVQAFFYGLLLVNLKQDKKGYWFLVLSMFIHFSLSIALVVYVLFRILPSKNLTILYGIYLITFFLAEVDLGVLRGYFEQLPSFLQSRKSYLGDEYAAGLIVSKQALAVHIVLYNILLKYIAVSLISWLFITHFYKQKGLNSEFSNWFAIVLFFSSFTNLASQIPSGGRFAVLSNLIVVVSFIWFLSQEQRTKVSPVIQNFIKVCFLYMIVVQVRIGLDYTGIFFFAGNPIINLMIQDQIPFITFIKALF